MYKVIIQGPLVVRRKPSLKISSTYIGYVSRFPLFYVDSSNVFIIYISNEGVNKKGSIIGSGGPTDTKALEMGLDFYLGQDEEIIYFKNGNLVDISKI